MSAKNSVQYPQRWERWRKQGALGALSDSAFRQTILLYNARKPVVLVDCRAFDSYRPPLGQSMPIGMHTRVRGYYRGR